MSSKLGHSGGLEALASCDTLLTKTLIFIKEGPSGEAHPS